MTFLLQFWQPTTSQYTKWLVRILWGSSVRLFIGMERIHGYVGWIQHSRDIQENCLFVCTKSMLSMLRTSLNPAIWQWCGLRSHQRVRWGLRQNELMCCRAHSLTTLTSTAVSPPWGDGHKGTGVWLEKLSTAHLTTPYWDDLHFSLGTSLISHVDKWVLFKWPSVPQMPTE